MNNWVLETTKNLFPQELLTSEHQTTLGRLYLANGDLRLGPKFLIRINDPLDPSKIEWEHFRIYLNGGHEEVCRDLFRVCNGMAFSHRFTVPGYLGHNPFDGEGVSFLNVPYCMGTLAYRGYPQFAPSEGYFVSCICLGNDGMEICDIVTPKGDIVFGEFRKNETVLGSFKTLQAWLAARIPQALQEMKADGLIGDIHLS